MTVVLQNRRAEDRRRSFDRRATSTMAAPDRAVRMAGVALIAALSVVDVVTSSWLRSRNGVEINPIAGWLIAHDLLGVAKLIAVGTVAFLLHRARAATWVTTAVWFVAGIYATIISLHVWQLGSS
jgi:hypothetical protein